MDKRFIMIIYAILFEMGVILPEYNKIISLVIILFNIVFVLMNKKLTGMALLSSFMFAGEIFPILNVIIVIALNGKRLRYQKPEVTHVVFFAFVFLISIVNAIKYDTYINVIVYSFYLMLLFIVSTFCIDKLSVNDVIFTIKGFIITEAVADIIIYIRVGIFSPGDVFAGTVQNAHIMGHWGLVNGVVLMYLLHNIKGQPWGKIIYSNIIYILADLMIIWLADCKALIVSMIIGTLLYYIFDTRMKLKNSLFICFVFLIVMMYLFSFIVNCNWVKDMITTIAPKYSRYLYESRDNFNGKATYIMGTITQQLTGIHFLSGYGLGQYGSRVANLFAYTIMWRGDNAINNLIANNFTPSFLPNYAQYVEYYTADFVENIKWRSAILSYPFNSFTALLGELGVLGSLGFVMIIQKYIKDSPCKFLVFYFMVACLFDTYFDNFSYIGLILLLLMNIKMQKRYE